MKMGELVNVVLTTNSAARIAKWKVKEGIMISKGHVLFVYDSITRDSVDKQLKFKCMQVGTVRRIIAKEGDIVQPGGPLLQLEECTHPTVMKDMCAECGADLTRDEQLSTRASIPMVHSIPELKVSYEHAQIIGKADENRLVADRKLVLLVDLDQTLIHTTNDNIPPNLKDVYHFQLYGPMSPWHHTRIRPRTHEFLEEISKYYELHICTFGARNYAHTIAMFLDPDGKYFSHRILSRDECFSANSKTANLKALFPCGDSMVCIIDDREDVWNHSSNLIHVKPYHFFRHTGDINAPPGLTKKENDEIDGYDFSDMDNISESAELEEVSDDEKQKKVPGAARDKIEILGESTTDKDTEDETEQKSKKIQDEVFDKIVRDLQLSEDDSGDTIIEQSRDEKTEKTEEGNSVTSQRVDISVENSTEQKSNNFHDEKEKNKKLDQGVEGANKKGNKNCEDTRKNAKSLEKTAVNIEKLEDEKVNPDDEELIEVVDPDDYLIYLEDMLKRIHKAYYEEYDARREKAKSFEMPDLKLIIPEVKQNALKGCNLVFSGMIQSHKPLKRSRAYRVALSLGATVSQDISSSCTHLVAARPGTAKVISSRRYKGIQVVTPLWLWHCAERWKRVDEKQYPLGRGGVIHRDPPAHCGSPEINQLEESGNYSAARCANQGRFIDTINPLLTFSTEDRRKMTQEVDDLFKNDEDSDSEDSDDSPDSDREETESEKGKVRNAKRKNSPNANKESSSSSSEDSLSGGAHPRGWETDKEKSRKRKADTTTCTDSDYEEESPSVKFRRGEPLPSDLDFGEDSHDSPATDELFDEAEWSQMGAALEREFLSGD